jgi:hypothetical protein
MNLKSLVTKFLWIAVGGLAFSIFCLALNGAGDHPESFRMYILSSTILLSASLISLALIEKKEDK